MKRSQSTYRLLISHDMTRRGRVLLNHRSVITFFSFQQNNRYIYIASISFASSIFLSDRKKTMTVAINEKKFDRIWTITAGFCCLLALVFTIIAIRTSLVFTNNEEKMIEIWYFLGHGQSMNILLMEKCNGMVFSTDVIV